MKAVLNIFQDNGKFEATHEIEIPEGAIGMMPLWQYRDGESVGHKDWVPIPRPKKVKKTVYLHVQNHNGRTVYSVHDWNTAPSEAYPVEIEVA